MKSILFALLLPNLALGGYATYVASIVEVPGSSSGVTGTAVVFSAGDGTTVGYAGVASGVEASLEAASCTATNGCGAHIHSGTSCADTSSQGGHYYETPVLTDPWIDERYTSDTSGEATFGAVVQLGTNDLQGRAFVIHDQSGSRVGCGLLTRVAQENILQTSTSELSSSGVTSSASAYQPNASDDLLCFFGKGSGLETSLSSYLDGGSDCAATNGCGVHVHSGSDCTSSATQQGHYYSSSLSSDPWATIGYLSTDASGDAFYVDCVETGEAAYTGKAFVVHANDGSRSSCGLLEDCPTANACNFLGLFPGHTMYGNFFGNCSEMCVTDFWVFLKSWMGFSCGTCP